MGYNTTPTHIVIGPSGKDVFSIAICHVAEDSVNLSSAMVEAISKDEALGIANRMTKKLKGQVLINIQSKLGSYCVKDREWID